MELVSPASGFPLVSMNRENDSESLLSASGRGTSSSHRQRWKNLEEQRQKNEQRPEQPCSTGHNPVQGKAEQVCCPAERRRRRAQGLALNSGTRMHRRSQLAHEWTRVCCWPKVHGSLNPVPKGTATQTGIQGWCCRRQRGGEPASCPGRRRGAHPQSVGKKAASEHAAPW